VGPSYVLGLDAPAVVDEGDEAAKKDSLYVRLRTPFADRVGAISDALKAGVSGRLSAYQTGAIGASDAVVKLIPGPPSAVHVEVVNVMEAQRRALDPALNEATRLANQLDQLATDMRSTEQWSQVDANRRLVEQQAASEEAKAFPEPQWPAFVLGIAATLFGIGSAAISVERLTGTLPDQSWNGDLTAAAFLVPWIAGAFLATLSLWAMKQGDDRRLKTYHALFGGQKY
jgi:hypothetical protein